MNKKSCQGFTRTFISLKQNAGSIGDGTFPIVVGKTVIPAKHRRNFLIVPSSRVSRQHRMLFVRFSCCPHAAKGIRLITSAPSANTRFFPQRSSPPQGAPGIKPAVRRTERGVSPFSASIRSFSGRTVMQCDMMRPPSRCITVSLTAFCLKFNSCRKRIIILGAQSPAIQWLAGLFTVWTVRPDEITVPLGQVLANSAHPRCIQTGSRPSSIPSKSTPEGVLFYVVLR